MTQKKRYRFLTGPDNAAFCQRISDALDDGYVLYGNPVMIATAEGPICGQAIILPDTSHSLGGTDAPEGNPS